MVFKKKTHDFSHFFERQADFAKKLQEKIASKRALQEENSNFKPVINKTSSILVDCSSSPLLHNKKLKKVCENTVFDAEKQENNYSKYNFSPLINTKSKKIGRVSSLESLAYDFSKQKIKEKKIEKINKDVIENCTFSPDLITKQKFSYVKSNYNQNENIIDKIKAAEKEKKEKHQSQKF